MPTTEALRLRLIEKLKELFQLNQPDLDFGFYRIMHAKAQQVSEFLDRDLIRIAEGAFGAANAQKMAQLQQAYEAALTSAREFGIDNPEETEPVKRAKAAMEAATDTAKSEAEVYDHLYRFFERYYDNGDFISRRYYARETGGKAAPYAIPYNGEEVKLHWANADQYYIKTAEYFSNFAFDLLKSEEAQKARGDLFAGGETQPRRVHFQIMEATEGEHGNVKATEQTRRFFLIHKGDPVGFNDVGDLVCRFEYRPDPAKSGQEGSWRDRRNEEAVETILKALDALAKSDKQASDYLALLKISAPTEKQPHRPLLAKYINQYTARNTMDYFIHKDLGGFLRRELDFYIKNEVMRLDDIESADVPRVEQYLSKIKVLRQIAGKIIEMLTQLEEFQKKLWLKKKFVVETQYCLTLDRIPEAFYPEIAANDAQREEWVRLFAIDEIEGDLHVPAYAVPLKPAFLKANQNLVLDTRHFDEAFKARLLEAIEDFEEQCDGVLIHSENFQALNFLKENYVEKIKSIFIDPPYNTDGDSFVYKDSYRHSSWISFLYNLFCLSYPLIKSDGNIAISIGENEYCNLARSLLSVFGEESYLGTLIWQKRKGGGNDSFFLALDHDYIPVFTKNKKAHNQKWRVPYEQEYLNRYRDEDQEGRFYWDTLSRPGLNNPIIYDVVCPDGTIIKDGQWQLSEVEFLRKKNKGDVRIVKDRKDNWSVHHKVRMPEGRVFRSLILTVTNNDAAKNLQDLFNDKKAFSNPKPVELLQALLVWMSAIDGISIDFFAGSGTTAHAVINLNREDGGSRKYILVEMGDYFDTVLKPRIQKVVYATDWKDGKPQSRTTGISHCFKYLRLESYEDCLNNLELVTDPVRDQAIAQHSGLREDYLLRYMLDVETRGSQSLLNLDAFADPTAYALKVKKPGTDAYDWKTVDLVETFNYLIGLRVVHVSVPQVFTANFKRLPDPDLPEDQQTRLVVDGKIRQDAGGAWWFRKVEGWVPRDADHPNNGDREKVLIVWRKLTDDLEKDNAMLDEWFTANRISTRDFEFDTIYVNGSNNLRVLTQFYVVKS